MQTVQVRGYEKEIRETAKQKRVGQKIVEAIKSVLGKNYIPEPVSPTLYNIFRKGGSDSAEYYAIVNYKKKLILIYAYDVENMTPYVVSFDF